MTCKGICIRHKAAKPIRGSRYGSGQRRCQICDIFIDIENLFKTMPDLDPRFKLFCLCCGYRLRTKPRNRKFKDKLRAQIIA